MGCLVSQVAAKFAFFPPSPASYGVRKGDDGNLIAYCATSDMPINDDSTDVLLLETKRGNKIVGFYLRNPLARLTLLYSHGNAADLGQLYDLFLQLTTSLRVNLFGYDYSGYGASTGRPSEYNTYADIEAVYECLETEYGISQEDIILYGQSLGSGPTLHLAAQLPRLRGVVLHSAILSGLRVLCHVKFTFCFDIYRNVNKIRKVKSPVLVIHGTADDVVDWLHGDGLWKLARDPYEPLWIEGGGHCDLELYPEYIQHLYTFVQEMENMTTDIYLIKFRQTLCLSKSSSSISLKSTNRCCGIKLICQCSTPSCLKCFSRPKCSQCQPRCPDCLKCCAIRCPCSLRCCVPKCRNILKRCVPRFPQFLKCCMPRCPDSLRCCIPRYPEFLKCCKPRCPDCLRPGLTKCSCSVKCTCWCINLPCWR